MDGSVPSIETIIKNRGLVFYKINVGGNPATQSVNPCSIMYYCEKPHSKENEKMSYEQLKACYEEIIRTIKDYVTGTPEFKFN